MPGLFAVGSFVTGAVQPAGGGARACCGAPTDPGDSSRVERISPLGSSRLAHSSTAFRTMLFPAWCSSGQSSLLRLGHLLE